MRSHIVTVINATGIRPLPSLRVARLARMILADQRRPAVVNVILTDNKTIRSLNAEFRGNNAPTDVLSFRLDEGGRDSLTPISGEVYISVQQAAKQADMVGHGLDDEILLLTSHGVLHLLGWTHETERKLQRMIRVQIEYLNRLYGKRCKSQSS